ncbi:hypothetical protein N0V93_002071 [Gnomoniopsis smithogilvyi]|uniref:EGF domain-specific O-linked N-acetylglucosamine transferase n=1 Tax=Gnomoniopsis smithogilvyi TaxID=1191159 RepID=A0A9W9D2S6_9PEZI|nr:hypothetical protein N0V93_002071 [Gnomoniopsis smithogilvyi]
MVSNVAHTKRRYSLFVCSTLLALSVLYYIYWTGDLPDLIDKKFSGNLQDTSNSSFSKAEEVKTIELPKPAFIIPSLSSSSSSSPSSSGAPTLPTEYSALAESQQQCKLYFTPSYLEHIATHQLPYCETQSLSAFHCFTAPRFVIPVTGNWGTTDPLCIAQGVSFHPGQGSDEFDIQCNLRDLATERASSVEVAKELEGFRDRPTDWGWYWGDTGVGASLKTWHFEHRGDVTGCTQKTNNSGWVMLMRRDSSDPHNLWHKLMEILQARHSLDALRIAINPATGKPWLSETDAANVQLVFDDDREELLQPLWDIVTSRKPIRKSSLQQPTCFGNVILPLPGCGSPFWSSLLDTGYSEHCPSQTLLTTYVNRIFDFYGITPRTAKEINKHPKITIVERKKNRKFISLDSWTATLKERYPHSDIEVVDFAGITIEEQIRLAQSTDILVGHHGAAMSHIIFMAAGATAVEVLPQYFDQHGFRAIAAMRGVHYIAGRCMYEEEYETVVHDIPLPQDWPPLRPQEFDHWQQQEWTYMTDDEFLGLVDAAVRSQMNRISSSDLQITL